MSQPYAPTGAMRNDDDGWGETEVSNREKSYNRYLIHDLEYFYLRWLVLTETYFYILNRIISHIKHAIFTGHQLRRHKTRVHGYISDVSCKQ